MFKLVLSLREATTTANTHYGDHDYQLQKLENCQRSYRKTTTHTYQQERQHTGLQTETKSRTYWTSL